MTITRFAGDHLAHHWGADRLMAGSAILAIACLVIAGTAPTQLVTLAAFLAAGLGIATLTPRLYDLAARAGNGTASGLGVLTGGMRTATILAPITIATVASATTAGTAIAVTSAIAGIGFLAAIRPHDRDERLGRGPSRIVVQPRGAPGRRHSIAAPAAAPGTRTPFGGGGA